MPEEESTLLDITNGNSYSHINDDAPCFADKDNYDHNNIVEEIVSKRSQIECPVAKDNDEEDSEPMVTYSTQHNFSRVTLLNKA